MGNDRVQSPDGPAGQASLPPPFSPVLLLGMMLRPVRPALLQPLFDGLVRAVLRRHPDLFERMEAYGDAVVRIDPIDLPFILLLEPDRLHPRLTVCRRDDASVAVTAAIRGSLDTLIALAEGRVDGDALFFSRHLVVEGDTEVVVALRNAIDGAAINLIDDFTAALGPFRGPARAAAQAGVGLIGRLRRDVDILRTALIAPALQKTQSQAAHLAQLETDLRALRKLSRPHVKGHVL